MSEGTITTNTIPSSKGHSMGASLRDMSAILENFVPKGEYNTLFEQFEGVKAEHAKLARQYEGVNVDKLNKRIAELEGHVRTRNYRDAYNKLVDDLGINPEFSDEVFELSKLTLDTDEPDLKKMKSVLKDFLELKPKFKVQEEGQAGQQQQHESGDIVIDPTSPTKPRLHTADTGGKASKATPPGRFPYRTQDLQSHEWMAKNAQAYAKAIQDGTAYKVG